MGRRTKVHPTRKGAFHAAGLPFLEDLPLLYLSPAPFSSLGAFTSTVFTSRDGAEGRPTFPQFPSPPVSDSQAAATTWTRGGGAFRGRGLLTLREQGRARARSLGGRRARMGSPGPPPAAGGAAVLAPALPRPRHETRRQGLGGGARRGGAPAQAYASPVRPRSERRVAVPPPHGFPVGSFLGGLSFWRHPPHLCPRSGPSFTLFAASWASEGGLSDRS